jgi:hypothetical protein
MTLHFNSIHGFADIADSVLAHDKPALGLHIARISDNAAFGMVRLEIFKGVYHDGDTVALPVSTATAISTSATNSITYGLSVTQPIRRRSGYLVLTRSGGAPG